MRGITHRAVSQPDAGLTQPDGQTAPHSQTGGRRFGRCQALPDSGRPWYSILALSLRLKHHPPFFLKASQRTHRMCRATKIKRLRMRTHHGIDPPRSGIRAQHAGEFATARQCRKAWWVRLVDEPIEHALGQDGVGDQKIPVLDQSNSEDTRNRGNRKCHSQPDSHRWLGFQQGDFHPRVPVNLVSAHCKMAESFLALRFREYLFSRRLPVPPTIGAVLAAPPKRNATLWKRWGRHL